MTAALQDNKDVYSTVEFDRWARRADLLSDERFVIERFLQRNLHTLEAGTAGGRILLAMKQMGFTALAGYDFVPGLIAQARQRDTDGVIDFQVQDATDLRYADASFDQILYLQQILCLIEPVEKRALALHEAYRILRPGGTAIFSFLSYEARAANPLYQIVFAYLRLVRLLKGSPRSIQESPWLRLGGRPNVGALLDRGPYVYWFTMREAAAFLRSAGFRLRAIASSHQLDQQRTCESRDALEREPIRGTLYCVCEK